MSALTTYELTGDFLNDLAFLPSDDLARGRASDAAALVHGCRRASTDQSSLTNQEQYRSDIDGLRAIAVSSVVLYHFGLPGFLNGSVGVDFFFVISGFLIGQIVLGQLDEQRFSFSTFYVRRIRRLFPAAMAMIVVTSALAYWLFLPKNFMEFGQSVVASVLYASNVLFYRQAGYFDTASLTKPLLHTWSLGVEEQFYLVFPLVAWLSHRYLRSWLLPFFLLALLASFAAAVFCMVHHPRAAFYLYPFRAWEMFIGTVLALRVGWLSRVARGNLTANLLGVAGVLGLARSICFDDSNVAFPAQGVLLACISAALIIVAGLNRHSLVARGLSIAPLVWIGRLSYSIYLWHWPLLVLYSYAKAGELSIADKSMLLAVTLVLSALAWRFIEEPIRCASFTWTRRPVSVFGWSALASLAFVAAGFYVYRTDGMPSRLSERAAQLAAVENDFFKDWSDCAPESNTQIPGLAYCATGDPSQMQDMVVAWGDSHALALKNGFLAMARERRRDALMFQKSSCPPVLGVDIRASNSTPDADRRCSRDNQAILAFLKQNQQRVKTIVLVGRWAYYTSGRGLGVDAHSAITLSPSEGAPSSSQSQPELLMAALDRTIDELRAQGHDVFILEQLPEFGDYSTSKLARGLRIGTADYEQTIASLGTQNYQLVQQRQAVMSVYLEAEELRSRASVLRSHSYFCKGDVCSLVLGGVPSYFDNNHVTAPAAVRLRGLFAPAMPELGGLASR